ncbi:hypothetical protein T08_817 [Trichinella sp. T8]|nr:hypothetical protein T08_817 [Trichinella sp. T8]
MVNEKCQCQAGKANMILKKFLLYSSSNKKRSAVIGQIFNSMNVNEDLAGKKQIASKNPIILHTDR